MAKYQDVVKMENGVKVTMCAPRRVKQGERTFTATKYSIASMGAKNVNLMSQGIKKSK
jgi:hypothetical protein